MSIWSNVNPKNPLVCTFFRCNSPCLAFYRVFHRAVLNVVDRTLGIRLSEPLTFPSKFFSYSQPCTDPGASSVAVQYLSLLHFMLVVSGAALLGETAFQPITQHSCNVLERHMLPALLGRAG